MASENPNDAKHFKHIDISQLLAPEEKEGVRLVIATLSLLVLRASTTNYSSKDLAEAAVADADALLAQLEETK